MVFSSMVKSKVDLEGASFDSDAHPGTQGLRHPNFPAVLAALYLSLLLLLLPRRLRVQPVSCPHSLKLETPALLHSLRDPPIGLQNYIWLSRCGTPLVHGPCSRVLCSSIVLDLVLRSTSRRSGRTSILVPKREGCSFYSTRASGARRLSCCSANCVSDFAVPRIR